MARQHCEANGCENIAQNLITITYRTAGTQAYLYEVHALPFADGIKRGEPEARLSRTFAGSHGFDR